MSSIVPGTRRVNVGCTPDPEDSITLFELAVTADISREPVHAEEQDLDAIIAAYGSLHPDETQATPATRAVACPHCGARDGFIFTAAEDGAAEFVCVDCFAFEPVPTVHPWTVAGKGGVA